MTQAQARAAGSGGNAPSRLRPTGSLHKHARWLETTCTYMCQGMFRQIVKGNGNCWITVWFVAC